MNVQTSVKDTKGFEGEGRGGGGGGVDGSVDGSIDGSIDGSVDGSVDGASGEVEGEREAIQMRPRCSANANQIPHTIRRLGDGKWANE